MEKKFIGLSVMEFIKRFSVYLFVFIVTVVLLFFFLWNRKTDLENAYLSQKMNKVNSEFKAVLDSYDKTVLLFFESFIDKSTIKENLYKATIDKKNISPYREIIFNYLKKPYFLLKKYNIDYLNFYFPDGTSFLRFHKIEKFGDREAINPINNKLNKTIGGFRYIFPLFYKKLLVGKVEVVVPFGTIRRDLNRLFNREHKFLIRKDFIFSRLFIEEGKNYVESDISPNFYYEVSPSEEKLSKLPSKVISQINLEIKDQVQTLLKKRKPFYLTAKVGSDFYVVSFIPIYAIKQLKKEYLGYLTTYEKDNSISIYRSSFWISFTTTSVIVFLLLLMAFSISYLKEKVFIEEAEEVDELTEAYNEKTFVSLLSSELARAKRYDRSLSLMVIDFPKLSSLEEEKKYEILKSLVKMIMENIRETDYIAHIDDTQIAVLAPETNTEEISNLAERIKEILERTHIDKLGRPKFYIGITEAYSSDTVETLLKRVKEALYLAREKDKKIETAV